MKPIKSLAELSPLILGQFKKGVIANGAFGVEAFENEIEEGTLFAEQIPGGLVLLRRRQGFWRMNFYLQPEADLTALELPDQTVTEIAVRPKDSALKNSEQLWERQGFRLMFSRQRMELLERSQSFTVRSDCKVRQAIKDDEPIVRQLMERNYDRRTACLPTDSELNFDIVSGNVWLAIDHQERTCGFLRLIRTKRTVEVRQIAVEKEFRGQGIAGALLDKLILEEGQRGLVWVACDNAAAVRLYESIEFVNDSWTSTVWLYEKG